MEVAYHVTHAVTHNAFPITLGELELPYSCSTMSGELAYYWHGKMSSYAVNFECVAYKAEVYLIGSMIWL